MTLHKAIMLANRDGDYPTCQDLADGLDRTIDSVSAQVAELCNANRLVVAGHTTGHKRRMRLQWRAV